MLATVKFYDQSWRWRMEINYVFAERTLPEKLDAQDLLSTQLMPEFLLGIGHVRTKLPRLLFQVGTIVQHR
jgi:hypothetical protein